MQRGASWLMWEALAPIRSQTNVFTRSSAHLALPQEVKGFPSDLPVANWKQELHQQRRVRTWNHLLLLHRVHIRGSDGHSDSVLTCSELPTFGVWPKIWKRCSLTLQFLKTACLRPFNYIKLSGHLTCKRIRFDIAFIPAQWKRGQYELLSIAAWVYDLNNSVQRPIKQISHKQALEIAFAEFGSS